MAQINVNNNTFSLTRKDEEMLLNDITLDYDIIQLPDGTFNLLLDNKKYSIEVLEKDINTGKLTIRINGRKVETTLNNKLSVLLKSMGMEGGKKKLKELKAPMPGLVLQVNVASGDEVEEGQDLLILEAMKMENSIKSPQAGTIDKINVNVNDKIDKGQVLISFN